MEEISKALRPAKRKPRKVKMSNAEIEKVVYIYYFGELYVQFKADVLPGYDTAVFINVPYGTVERFSVAEDKEAFFRENILHKYRYHLTLIEFAELLAESTKA